MEIKVENVSYTYDVSSPFETAALYDINFVIKSGEFVSLMGHSGCGKSTLVQQLNGLMKPASGRVLIDGVDINGPDAKAKEYRHKVGLVFQYPEYQLFEETVLKDVAFAPQNFGFSKEESLKKAAEALRLVDIDPEIYGERSPFEISGGEKRRVAIAGVLAMDPELIILDEPTAGLDPQSHRDVMTMLGRLHMNTGKAILMVSHDMRDIAEMSNRVMVMDRGKLVLDGDPKEVFKNEEYITSIGLELPPSKKLLKELEAAGLLVDTDSVNYADSVKKIMQAK